MLDCVDWREGGKGGGTEERERTGGGRRVGKEAEKKGWRGERNGNRWNWNRMGSNKGNLSRAG